MQHRFRASRAPHACFVSLFAIAAAACSNDYAIGGSSERSLPVEGVPGTAGVNQTGSADAELDALLAPADVTLSWRDTLSPQGPVGVGDIDGDGFDDFAAKGLDDATIIAYVHLRYGGPEPVEERDKLALAESGARLAFEENSPGILSVDGAGDVDGDGFGDLLVTTQVCDPLVTSQGAYLLYGGPERLEGVLSIADVAAHLKLPAERQGQGACGTPSNAQLGLGDIDGDGLGDFMLVHFQSPDSADPSQILDPTRSRGYVFYGREERLTSDVTWLDADATIAADQSFAAVPVGDVTADGRADFALGAELAPYLWVPGSTQRLSGEVDARTAFATIPCADGECAAPPVSRAGDVDGDGIDDVLANEGYQRTHLFYGAPGLLDGGLLDFQNAAASFVDDLAMPLQRLLVAAGDRDGDGDSDLLSLFYSDAEYEHTDVTFVSGSSTRLAGVQGLPIQAAIATRPGGLPFPSNIQFPAPAFESGRTVRSAANAGDLNGDGADDLLTTSVRLMTDSNGAKLVYFPQIHIHYGTPVAPPSAGVR